MHLEDADMTLALLRIMQTKENEDMNGSELLRIMQIRKRGTSGHLTRRKCSSHRKRRMQVPYKTQKGDNCNSDDEEYVSTTTQNV